VNGEKEMLLCCLAFRITCFNDPKAFQKDVSALSSIYERIRTFKTWRTSVPDEHRVGRPLLDHIDSEIRLLFQENESQSVRSLAQELNVSLSTIHARLTDVLSFSLRHTRWVSYFLTDKLKVARVAISTKMFEMLEHEEQTHVAGIITGDEPWFFLVLQKARMEIKQRKFPGRHFTTN
jgi:hypothetical protein